MDRVDQEEGDETEGGVREDQIPSHVRRRVLREQRKAEMAPHLEGKSWW